MIVNITVQTLAKENTYRIDYAKCAAGWAVTVGLLSSTANPEMGAPTSLVFQQQGSTWVSRDKRKVCGTNASTTPAPADAKDSRRTVGGRLPGRIARRFLPRWVNLAGCRGEHTFR
ncbi:hypothetical protein MSAR_40600 [Mycolicibacterium sarraceniae]|uniref:Uncharacterized protein n=1 Tax=Mycolicibacterium sarraceniae TaxID=1534348 RepID=A0A7I7SV80_9MYCO|nr:hypothetical protein MSAR_40600 [Mycolicibacterium sarraceniae]